MNFTEKRAIKSDNYY